MELTESLLDGLWVWDLRDQRCWCSANLMRLFGLGQEATWMEGDAWHVWVEDKELFDRFWQSLLQATDLHEGCLVRLAIPVSNNQWTVHIHGRIVARDDAGKPTKIIGFFQDRTAQSVSNAVVEQGTHLLDLALRNTPVVVQIFSRAGYVYISENCLELFGYSRAEIAGMLDFSIVHPDDREANRQGIGRSLADPGTVYGDDCRIVRKDGSVKWIHVDGCFYREGPLAGNFVSCIYSIDERKRLQDELQRHRDQLEVLVAERTADLQRANDLLRERESQLIRAGKLSAIGTLVAGVAHEVQTPAATIALGLDLLFDADLSPADRNAQCDRMRRACQHIVEVVENLKDFSRDHGKTDQENVLVSEIVDGAVSLVRDLARRHRASISISSQVLPLRIRVSQRRMMQVIVNTLINACQALPTSGGKIGISWKSTGKNVEILIEDDGCGIPAELQPRLCEPFFTTKAERGGLGLGLSVSHGIVREHGGEILFIQRPSGGTGVTIQLPL